MKNYLLLIFIGIAMSCSKVYGQQSIQFVDKNTRESLPGVIVGEMGSNQVFLSNDEGLVIIPKEITQGDFVISYLGYEKQSLGFTELQSINTIEMQPSVFMLNQVVATASRVRQSRNEVPAAIASISQIQLQQTRPTLIGQAINKIAGVYMTNLGNEQHTMSIRQPISARPYYLYLENGIPIRPLGAFNHNTLYEINMAGAERIEVIKGPASSIYGSNAVGGTINFIGFEPTADPFAEISIQGDNLGYRRTDFIGGISGEKLGATLSGYYAENQQGFRDFTQFNKFAISPRIFYRFNDKTKIEFNTSYIYYRNNLPGSLDSIQYAERSRFNRYTFTYRDINALRSNVAFDHIFNSQHRINVSAFFRDNTFLFNSDHTIRDVVGEPERATGSLADNSFTGGGLLVRHQWNTGVGRLITGLYGDFNTNTLMDELLDIDRVLIDGSPQYNAFRQTGTFVRDYKVNLNNMAAFTQYEVALSRNLKFLTGLRYDYISYDFVNFLEPGPTTGAPDEFRSFTNLSYKFGLTYQLNKYSFLYASMNQGFVPPEVTELYRTQDVPDLSEAVFYNYEIGGGYSIPSAGLNFEAAVYYMQGLNEIIGIRLIEGLNVNRNAAETRHAGVELTAIKKIQSNLHVRFSGNYAIHQFVEFREAEDGPDFNGNDMPSAPRWINNAEIIYSPPGRLQGFRASLEWQMISSFFVNNNNLDSYGGHHLFHARIAYKAKNFEIWSNAINLFDTLFAESASRNNAGQWRFNPGAPRSVNLGIAFQLGR